MKNSIIKSAKFFKAYEAFEFEGNEKITESNLEVRWFKTEKARDAYSFNQRPSEKGSKGYIYTGIGEIGYDILDLDGVTTKVIYGNKLPKGYIVTYIRVYQSDRIRFIDIKRVTNETTSDLYADRDNSSNWQQSHIANLKELISYFNWNWTDEDVLSRAKEILK